jgi:NADH:ubiquinone oxidoreductase subunit E
MKTEEIKTALKGITEKYPHNESAMLPALYYMQHQNGNSLSEKDIQLVAQVFGVSESKVFGVATYYTMFNKKPVGKYHIQVDTNISAMLMGAEEIVSKLEKTLNIKVGETTPDGTFTLSTV